MIALLAVLLAASAAPARAVSTAATSPAARAPAAPVLSDAQVRAAVQAYLGSIDTPIPDARWRALGPRAEPALREVAQGSALPTRRAKALDGLAALAPRGAPAVFRALAADEAQPLNVRYAALRGLGRTLPAGALLAALRPLLETAADPRVRAKAGEELTRRIPAESCPLLRAQVARERAEVRPQFDGAREGCLGR